ncbi:ImmA/IrrE family metallo-endopeptidase [Microbacterium sulfonylureivorans]|uniref:ImmA/IrrE family metallo-endopeptidase n=1 Tax=Microbacterium sulfonylureivorans TaxID=2486854 RepID=UPI000FDCA89E|nr:ImmA/IrrE family metallo-endopeptidase [Microbacterium sulfonylureivorans]
MEAARLHARLGTDMSIPIDVFEVVRELGVWLSARDLSSTLFGFYLSDGGTFGICLNDRHPEPLQRLTCAHELGHHMLGHQSALDLERHISGGGDTSLAEVEAQAFASAFLMPPGLVNRKMRTLDLNGRSGLTDLDLYRLARTMDTSFSATVWRLVDLEILTPAAAKELARKGPSKAKAILIQPFAAPGRGEVVEVDAERQDLALCRVGDHVMVDLPNHGDSGYIWVADGQLPGSFPPGLVWDGAGTLAQAAQPLVARHAPESGGGSRLHFQFEAPGPAEVSMQLIRPWEASPRPAAELPLNVVVQPEHQVVGMDAAQIGAYARRVGS